MWQGMGPYSEKLNLHPPGSFLAHPPGSYEPLLIAKHTNSNVFGQIPDISPCCGCYVMLKRYIWVTKQASEPNEWGSLGISSGPQYPNTSKLQGFQGYPGSTGTPQESPGQPGLGYPRARRYPWEPQDTLGYPQGVRGSFHKRRSFYKRAPC